MDLRARHYQPIDLSQANLNLPTRWIQGQSDVLLPEDRSHTFHSITRIPFSTDTGRSPRQTDRPLVASYDMLGFAAGLNSPVLPEPAGGHKHVEILIKVKGTG